MEFGKQINCLGHRLGQRQEPAQLPPWGFQLCSAPGGGVVFYLRERILVLTGSAVGLKVNGSSFPSNAEPPLLKFRVGIAALKSDGSAPTAWS